MATRIFWVDAFTNRPFTGNPAAVCLLATPRPDTWLQHLAAELRCSETAFLLPDGDGFQLRWFTPTTEVDLCGHATLASAHVLWEAGHLPLDAPARFQTRSGLLTAEYRDGWITLDFPATPAQPIATPPALVAALGVEPCFVGQSCFDYLVELADEATVRTLAPAMEQLAALPVRGVIVTSRAEPGRDYDIVSRFFAPQLGIPEDPVTGSAHCCLGPFWSARLGRNTITAYQASPRGGLLRVQVADSRVFLSGQAVTVLRGELLA